MDNMGRPAWANVDMGFVYNYPFILNSAGWGRLVEP